MRTSLIFVVALSLLVAQTSFANEVADTQKPRECSSRYGCATMLVLDGVGIAASIALNLVAGSRLSFRDRISLSREAGALVRNKDLREEILLFSTVIQACVLASGFVTVPTCLFR